MVGSISATAVYVESLPAPPQLMISRPLPIMEGGGGGGRGGEEEQMVVAMAKKVEQMATINRQRLQVRWVKGVLTRALTNTLGMGVDWTGLD